MKILSDSRQLVSTLHQLYCVTPSLPSTITSNGFSLFWRTFQCMMHFGKLNILIYVTRCTERRSLWIIRQYIKQSTIKYNITQHNMIQHNTQTHKSQHNSAVDTALSTNLRHSSTTVQNKMTDWQSFNKNAALSTADTISCELQNL
jgi:hypothetical protein